MKNIKINNVEISNTEVFKNIKNKLSYYTTENFKRDCEDYINAINNSSMLCVIKSVSSSGMSRTLKFSSFVQNENNGYYRNYNYLFIALGYKESKKDGFVISGCGMDMVFHTNYSIIHKLVNLGLITKELCNTLAQKTPTVL